MPALLAGLRWHADAECIALPWAPNTPADPPRFCSAQTELLTDDEETISSDVAGADISDSCSAEVRPNTDLYGGDLSDDAYYSVSSWQECCSLCWDEPNCLAW